MGKRIDTASMETFVGFDSAWTDNPKAPGAITALCFDHHGACTFHQPRLASFDQAQVFIRQVSVPNGFTLVALDQPTIVQNATGMRPVERAAASLISWLGGGVQPSNMGKIGMFCEASPVWRFLEQLGAREDPEFARGAEQGSFIMEVFPAIALASFEASFFGRLAAPRYNPARRKTFHLDHWVRVAEVAASQAESFGCDELAAWCRNTTSLTRPTKADQDRLDAALCALIALRWRRSPREDSILLGELSTGYMVLPASAAVRTRLGEAAIRYGVLIDGR